MSTDTQPDLEGRGLARAYLRLVAALAEIEQQESKTPNVATLGGAATNGAEQDDQKRPTHGSS